MILMVITLYNLSHSKTYIDLLGNISTMFTDEVMDSPLLKKQMDDSLKLIRAVFLEGVKEEDLKLVWTDPIDPTLTITTDPK